MEISIRTVIAILLILVFMIFFILIFTGSFSESGGFLNDLWNGIASLIPIGSE